jgi:hypothetical protein
MPPPHAPAGPGRARQRSPLPTRAVLPAGLSDQLLPLLGPGHLFTIAAKFTDPHVYFLGGGVVEAAPHFRDWFLGRVRQHTILREEQVNAASIALVPDLDMAGARGSAIAVRSAVL